MKKLNIRSWVITLALAAGMVPFSQSFGAQNQNQDPNQQRRNSPTAQQQPPGSEQQSPNDTKQARTYVGKIIKAKNGQFALLTDPQRGKGFFLDNQEAAQKFDQKNVKVVATLDTHTMILHVINIELAS
ncbi:MAG: hypothetical protein EPN47_00585 [Acidobacteria bacterium]|nr:MAG: hypothetical protein EPN47_00585 [Acidobacteriota bacterium]